METASIAYTLPKTKIVGERSQALSSAIGAGFTLVVAENTSNDLQALQRAFADNTNTLIALKVPL